MYVSLQMKKLSVFRVLPMVLCLIGLTLPLSAVPALETHPEASQLSIGQGWWSEVDFAADRGFSKAFEIHDPGLLLLQSNLGRADVDSVVWLEVEVVSFDGSRFETTTRLGFLDEGRIEIKRPCIVLLRVGLVDPNRALDSGQLRVAAFLSPLPVVLELYDGEPGSDTEEAEDEPLPNQGTEVSPVCGPTSRLDEFRSCAVQIDFTDVVEGSLDALNGLDHDYFRFRTDQVVDLALVVVGEVEIAGTLFDGNGRALLSSDPSVSEWSLRTTLVPGPYFLRLSGYGPGTYQMVLRPNSRPSP